MEAPESITLLQAAGHYASNVKAKDNHEVMRRELFRFVNWCGPDKLLAQINPSEIGDYADQLGGTGTSPQAVERLQVIRDFLSFSKKKGLLEKNLAQHLRIRKPRTRVGKAQGREPAEVIELTSSGYTQLVDELERLKSERAPIAMQIQKAAADKDVRENAPLEAAREQLGLVESRIRTIENTLKYAVVIDQSLRKGSNQTVKLGMRVSVKDLKTKRESTYTLVSGSEANSLEGKISDVSPLGKAIVGCKVGQEVDVESPRGKARYAITKVVA
ncbi:MAG: transcription elongation factor GreA [Chloroflexi bacterium]|nr:transcription elongation factor GreA [Chloroflexota bacterium]